MSSTHATTVIPLPFAETVESIPPDEAGDIERIIDILRQMLRMHFEKTGERGRDVHLKGHGSARGEFQVLAGLSDELAQGLFARPQTYGAVIRFSNSAPWRQPDAVPDGRGMAIQVENVTGESVASEARTNTQDFVMVNHSTFIAATVKDYLALEEARLRASDQPVLVGPMLLSRAWNPLRWSWKGILAAGQVARQFPSHPANYSYYSMVPIRYGQYVAKYRVIPERSEPASVLRRGAMLATNADAMRVMLAESLQQQELRFAFQVQLRTSEVSMPVEDATAEWPESESPYRTVATLVLPKQKLSAAADEEDLNRLRFSVWNALQAHRPLGGINRVRRMAYATSADWRQASGSP